MTLIASTSNNNFPILIGDVLITSAQRGDESKLPEYLRNIDTHFPDQDYFPVKLRQKIYVIHDKLCIGFAGDLYYIKLLLDDIQSHFSYIEPSIDTLNDFFKQYDLDCDFDGTNFLAIFLDSTDNKIHYFRKGLWETTDSPAFGHTFAMGSGQKDFIEQINKGYNYDNNVGVNAADQAISLNYINLANILGYERLSLTTIQKYWGAGFEMIYFNGSKFSKMDDITYSIWRGKYNPDTKSIESSPYLFLNYRYFGEMLVLSSIDHKEQAGLHGILPINKSIEQFDMSKIPTNIHFDSKKICAIFLIEFPNGKIFSPAFFNHASDDENDLPTIRVFFNENNQLSIMIKTEFKDFFDNLCKEKAESEGLN
jgi:hypothetical protein